MSEFDAASVEDRVYAIKVHRTKAQMAAQDAKLLENERARNAVSRH